jgi:hypothetical protein
MTERKPIRSEEELVRAFDQLFDEIPAPKTRDEIDDYIRDAGINPDEFGAHIREITGYALKVSPLNWRNRSQGEINRARATLNKIIQLAGQNREELLSKIDKVMDKIAAVNPSLSTIQYRNRAELSAEDLTSLLEELLFVAEQSNIDINSDD